MTLIRSSIDYQLGELTKVTGKYWAMNYHPDYGGEIIQPNGIEIHFDTLNEALSILGEVLDIVKRGEMAWCLH